MSEFGMSRRGVLATGGGLAAASLIGLRAPRAQGAPIRIGELNSYSRMAAFSVPYQPRRRRDGWPAAGIRLPRRWRNAR
jgi:branched-chain amino acid transport system substrate-binding protein